MEEKRTINVDYIAIVRQVGNLVKLEHIDIRKPESLLSDLKAILEDPERTLLDLQSRMCESYEEDRRRGLSYLENCSYTNAHISGWVSFPKIYSSDEYKEMLEDIEARTIRQKSLSLSRTKERDGETAYQEKLKTYIDDVLKKKKEEYYRLCLSFITATTFNDTVAECKEDPTIKLYSNASCGSWTKDLRVNSDIVLSITAQLGYSSQSAHLGISLWYKGILIHPYSFFVSHFRKYIKYIYRKFGQSKHENPCDTKIFSTFCIIISLRDSETIDVSFATLSGKLIVMCNAIAISSLSSITSDI